MSDMLRNVYPGGARYRTGAPEVDPYAAYTPEAQVWNNELSLGQLDTEGIKQRVWANAHNQNVYLESLNQRMKAMEDDDPSEANQYQFQKMFLEIRAVKDSSQGQPWADAFNNVLQSYEDRATKGYNYNAGVP